MLDTIFNIEQDTVQKGFTSFDFAPIDRSNLTFDVDSIVGQSAFAERISGVPVTVPSSVSDVFFAVFCVSFILLAIVTHKESTIFQYYFSSLFSKKSRTGFKEQITIQRLWTSLLFVVQTAGISSVVVTFMLMKNDFVGFYAYDVYSVLLFVFVGIMLFIGAKYIIYRLIDYIFPDWGLGDWVSQFFTYIGVVGLVAYLPSLMFVFSNEYASIAIWLIIASLIAISFVYYRNLFVIFVKNNIGVLNYFLYLCAIEIVPLFLLLKGGEILAIIAGK